MRDLNSKELKSIGGAGDPLTDQNSQLIRQIMIGAGWGMIWGLPMGFPGMAAGALTATTQTVLQGAASRMPVKVPIPRVPMGPTWNGSK